MLRHDPEKPARETIQETGFQITSSNKVRRRITDSYFLPELCNSAKLAALTDRKATGKLWDKVIRCQFSTPLPGDRAEKCLHHGQNIFDDDIDTAGGRMQPVRLVEPGVGGDPFQEERVERDAEGF